MNFGQIYGEVGQNMTSSDPSRCKLWVNAAYHQILAGSRYSYLEITSAAVALVASQQAYTLIGSSPIVPDFGGIIDVRLEITASGARQKLKNMNQQSFDDFADVSRVNGTPVMYTLAGGAPPSSGSSNIVSSGHTDLLLWPIPTASAGQGVNIFVRYYRDADSVEMSADSDVPIIPVQHHWAIVELAKALALADDDQTAQAQQFMQMAQDRISLMQAEDMAFRSGDNQVWSVRPLPTLPPTAQLTQRDYDPNSRPYGEHA